MPISISTALAASCVPALAAAFAQKDDAQVRSKIGISMRFIMVVAMPCTAGIMVLADPIIQLLFPGSGPLAGHLLQAGGISVIFYSISTLSNAVLQGIDRMRDSGPKCFRGTGASCGCHRGRQCSALKLKIYGICVGTIAFSLIMCILNGIVGTETFRLSSRDVTKTFVKPAIASVIMGVVVYADILCRAIKHPTAMPSVPLIAVLVGMIVYAAALLLIKGLTEEELHSFPDCKANSIYCKKIDKNHFAERR